MSDGSMVVRLVASKDDDWAGLLGSCWAELKAPMRAAEMAPRSAVSMDGGKAGRWAASLADQRDPMRAGQRG